MAISAIRLSPAVNLDLTLNIFLCPLWLKSGVTSLLKDLQAEKKPYMKETYIKKKKPSVKLHNFHSLLSTGSFLRTVLLSGQAYKLLVGSGERFTWKDTDVGGLQAELKVREAVPVLR